MADSDFEHLHKKQNLLTTLVLFLVFIELARILTTLNWSHRSKRNRRLPHRNRVVTRIFLVVSQLLFATR
ncbi:hypothetical protein [Haladaptatus cibarius]|uniref:hypothetical protein n=1 Tax=Haladaptatus cibarius TaxID=453847 RepID=UPI000678EB05|nr:hypothetical protein [Haladaptatus cibarius]